MSGCLAIMIGFYPHCTGAANPFFVYPVCCIYEGLPGQFFKGIVDRICKIYLSSGIAFADEIV